MGNVGGPLIWPGVPSGGQMVSALDKQEPGRGPVAPLPGISDGQEHLL